MGSASTSRSLIVMVSLPLYRMGAEMARRIFRAVRLSRTNRKENSVINCRI